MFEKTVTKYTLSYDATESIIAGMREFYVSRRSNSSYADTALSLCDVMDKFVCNAKECDDDINSLIPRAADSSSRMPSRAKLMSCIRLKIARMGLPPVVAAYIEQWAYNYIQVVRIAGIALPTNSPMAVLSVVVRYLALQIACASAHRITNSYMDTLMFEQNLTKELMLSHFRN